MLVILGIASRDSKGVANSLPVVAKDIAFVEDDQVHEVAEFDPFNPVMLEAVEVLALLDFHVSSDLAWSKLKHEVLELTVLQQDVCVLIDLVAHLHHGHLILAHLIIQFLPLFHELLFKFLTRLFPEVLGLHELYDLPLVIIEIQ